MFQNVASGLFDDTAAPETATTQLHGNTDEEDEEPVDGGLGAHQPFSMPPLT